MHSSIVADTVALKLPLQMPAPVRLKTASYFEHAFWCSDVHGRIAYANQAASTLLSDRATGLDWLDIVHPEDRDSIQDLHLRSTCQRRGYSASIRILRDDHYEVVPIHCLEQINRHGQLEGFIGFSGYFLPEATGHAQTQDIPVVGIQLDGILADTLHPGSGNQIPLFGDIDLAALNLYLEEERFYGYFFYSPQVGRTAAQFLRKRLEESTGGNCSGAFYYDAVLPDSNPALCLALGVNIFLTDDPDLVLHFRAYGIQAYLFRRPWNAHVRMPFVLHSLDDLVALL